MRGAGKILFGNGGVREKVPLRYMLSFILVVQSGREKQLSVVECIRAEGTVPHSWTLERVGLFRLPRFL